MKNPKRTLLAFICLITLSTVAHGQESVDNYFEDASRRFATGDSDGAVLQLRNALLQNPDHLPSLLLLGKIDYAGDKFFEAKRSYLHALAQGAAPDVVIPRLADIYLQLDLFKELIDEFPPQSVPDNARADLLGYHAMAYVSLGKRRKAEVAIAEAQAIDKDALPPGLAEVLLLLQQEQSSEALRRAQRLTARHIRDYRSWHIQALAQQASEQWEPAYKSYAQVIEMKPGHLDARLQHATLAIRLNLNQAAKEDLEFLGRAYPMHPFAAYLRSQLAARAGDLEVQRDELQTCIDLTALMAIGKVARDRQISMAAALAHREFGNFEAANKYLKSYTDLNPGDLEMIILYSGVLHQLGEFGEMRRMLAPWSLRLPDNRKVAWLLASAEINSGDLKAALPLVSKLDPADTATRELLLRMARLRMARGDSMTASVELADLLAADPTNEDARLLLAEAHVNQKEPKKALALLNEPALPESAFARRNNLAAMAHLQLGETAQARNALQAVQERFPDDFITRLNLVRVTLAEGNADAAIRNLQGLQKARPDSADATFLYAKAEYQRDNFAQAIRWSENALELAPDSVEIGGFLVRLYVRQNQLDAAANLSRRLVRANETDVESVALLAEVLMRQDQRRQALKTYRIAAARMSSMPGRLVPLAQLQAAQGAFDDARTTLDKALIADASYLPAIVAGIELSIARGEYTEAAEAAERLLSEQPTAQRVYELLAESLMRLERYQEAYNVSARGLALGHSSALVTNQYLVTLLSGDTVRAARILEASLRAHPTDLALAETYANLFLIQGRWQASEAILRQLVRLQPENPRLLNNLALTYLQLDREEALPMAQRAVALSPDDPLINDTVGWILVNRGQPMEGIPYLRNAIVRSADNGELRYHLAVALNAVGRSDEARAELQRALASPAPFTGRDAAQSLWSSLQ